MKIERKLYAVTLVSILLGTGILSVLATRTFTDSNDTWTGTIVQSGNLDFKSGVYFNLSKKIYTSNGLVYNATGANLQDAIDSLNNQSGWVNGGGTNVSITTAVQVGNHCELFNVNLWLASSANRTMLKNYTGGSTDIYIHDITLNGNGINQPVWWKSNADWKRYAHAIFFRNSNHITIENVFVNNSQSAGIYFLKCENITVSECTIDNAGVGYRLSATKYLHWFCPGILYDWTNHSIISDCTVNRPYAIGICMEAIVGSGITGVSHDVVISGCQVFNTEIGYYYERSRRITTTSCIASNCTGFYVYHSPTGFYSHPSYFFDSSFNGCIASYSGTANHTYGSNFFIGGRNNSLTGCKSIKGYKYGFAVEGRNVSLAACTSSNDYNHAMYIYDSYNVSVVGGSINECSTGSGILYLSTSNNINKGGSITGVSIFDCNGDAGIEIRSYNLTVTGCTINEAGAAGHGIWIKGMFNTISGNHISQSGVDGIHVDGGNNSICNNIIYSASDGIDVNSGNNSFMGNIIRSCTNGIDEGTGSAFNFYVGNNCIACTNGYDINTVNYKPYPQVNFTNFNFGSWT